MCKLHTLFIESSGCIELKISEKVKLASMPSDKGPRIKHARVFINLFWIDIIKEYPLVLKKRS